jgi:ABC-type arginine/histidine transport system permease subunit
MGFDAAKWTALGLTIVATLVGFGVSVGVALARVNDATATNVTQTAKIEAQAILGASMSAQLTAIVNDLHDIKEELRGRRPNQ